MWQKEVRPYTFSVPEVQERLMKLLNDMFDFKLEQNARLNHQQDVLKKKKEIQCKKQMFFVQFQTDLQDASMMKTVRYQAVSTQTEMDGQETKCQLKQVH